MRSMKNWLASVLAKWTRSRRGATTKLRPRLVLEALEERTAPAVLTVNSTADTASGANAYLTLREAVAIVNSPSLPSDLSPQILGQINGTLHLNSSDTILFVVSDPITLGGSQLELSLPNTTATITIDGGTTGMTVDGNQASRILQVDSGVQAVLVHLTLQNGRAARGGGIFNDNGGMLTVSNSTLSGNSAQEAAGGIDNWGMMSLQGCLVTNNTAGGEGGITNTGTMSITNSTISFNTSYSGGGISNYGTMVLQGGQVTDKFRFRHRGHLQWPFRHARHHGHCDY